MSRKVYVRPKKGLSERFRFLQILICLDHKLREHITKSWDSFDLPAPMLRDSVISNRVNSILKNSNFFLVYLKKDLSIMNVWNVNWKCAFIIFILNMKFEIFWLVTKGDQSRTKQWKQFKLNKNLSLQG